MWSQGTEGVTRALGRPFLLKGAAAEGSGTGAAWLSGNSEAGG